MIMFKKIISFIAAAACAAAVTQTAFALDGSIETVTDSSGAVRIYVVYVHDENDATRSTYFFTDKDGNHLNGRFYGIFADENELVSRILLADFEDGAAHYVNGFTESSEGKRYYTRGERAYGWKKIDGCWYHFDVKSGYMDTGRTKICGATYIFDEKGRWTHRVAKSGLAPKDFCVRLTGAIKDGFDTAEKKLYYGQTGNGIAEAKVKISARDRQIFWSMFLESGFELGSSEEFCGEYVEDFCREALPEGSDYILYTSEPEYIYTVTVTADGKTAKITYNTDTDHIALSDEKAYHAMLLEKQYRAYCRELEEKYPYTGEDEIFFLE